MARQTDVLLLKINDLKMRLKQIILFGLIYTLVYFFLAIGCAAGGHGTLIFFAPLFTWILLFPALFLLTRLNRGFINYILFVVLMLMHYAHIVFFLSPLFSLDIDKGTMKIWEHRPEAILITAAWYLAGQIIIWIFFYNATRKQALLKQHKKQSFNSV